MKISLLLLLLTLISCGVKTKRTSATLSKIPTENPGEPPEIPTNPIYEQDVTLKISWTRPYCYTNNTELPLSEIGGYNFYFGLTKNVYEPTIDIAQNDATSFDFDINGDGTYHFTLETYDINNVQSEKATPVIVECLNNSCKQTSTPITSVNTCPFTPVIESG
ncbi:MAG: hypothetical protein HON90_17620, partial [Halobacteriovoraceae bacterium]|nr:hypothetical protein [Halobacteriovoraceae bacterium]